MSLQQQSGKISLISVSVAREQDVVTARRRARDIAVSLGFSHQEQVRIATAVSETARNAVQYGGGGKVEFSLSTEQPQQLVIEVSDRGPGIRDLEAILEGRYQSRTGMGLGLVGSRRLVDRMEVDSEPGEGTRVRLEKAIPRIQPVSKRDVAAIAETLTRQSALQADSDARQQELDLLEALQSVRARELDLERREADLHRLNIELEETNRGVVALYAELDEKAAALRRADDLKSRFLRHVSHEFRTPLNSILALTQLLLRRTDGDLTAEQEKQVSYVRRAAQELIDMVNDLLDLAKVEAGKTEVVHTWFDVGQLFGVIRGIMRPLAINDAVALIFEDPPPGLAAFSDESKVSQVLRNLVSNALKFTERGEIRVRAAGSEDGTSVLISVADTGIGIQPQDQERIFQEFSQLDSPIQRKVKGTGLGLPLSRKLAELLGGSLSVQSEPGKGSTFTLQIPTGLNAPRTGHVSSTVLVIDDEETARYLAAQLFRGTHYEVIEATGGVEGAERARFERPAMILLDIMMPDRNGFDVLQELKSDPRTADIPVVIHTSRQLNDVDRERLGGREAAILYKGETGRRDALEKMRALLNDPLLFAGELGRSA